jgi:hypothetical protein
MGQHILHAEANKLLALIGSRNFCHLSSQVYFLPLYWNAQAIVVCATNTKCAHECNIHTNSHQTYFIITNMAVEIMLSSEKVRVMTFEPGNIMWLQ